MKRRRVLRCTRCATLRPLRSYSPDKRRPGAMNQPCRKCRSELQRERDESERREAERRARHAAAIFRVLPDWMTVGASKISWYLGLCRSNIPT